MYEITFTRLEAILHELGDKTADEYRSSTLKLKLQQHFCKRISIISQSSGSGFICASTVPLGDALEKLKHLEVELHEDVKYHTLQCAAKILRADSKLCKRQIKHELSTEISFDAANKIVPDSFFNFTAMLLCDKTPELQDSEE